MKKNIRYGIKETAFDTEDKMPRLLTAAELAQMAAMTERSFIPIPKSDPDRRRHEILGGFAMVLVEAGVSPSHKTLHDLYAVIEKDYK
jgi:hypothetical protein